MQASSPPPASAFFQPARLARFFPWRAGRLAGLVLLLAALTSASLLTAAEPARFELRDGDRVVLLGDGLIEQEQYAGWWELMLTTSWPDRHVIFRNLGWSGDTPAGASRCGLSLVQAGYEPEGEGFRQLQQQLEQTRPTVLIVGYGMASMLEGGLDGATPFYKDMQNLVKAARDIAPEVRFVFLTPLTPLDGQPGLVASYADVVRRIAVETGSPWVDLTAAAVDSALRKDPIHLNEAGYRATAETLHKQLRLPDSPWNTSGHAEALRQAILRKNTWWFHRSRPANMAYVFGFRRREQGQNAVEIPQFDPLIEQEERIIAQLRRLDGATVPPPAYRRESKYAQFQPQPLPEFTVAEGFEVTLWAQNPMLNKPIHMNFDAQGRLWVASSEAYPMIEVGQMSPDRIVVLEDSDGDGKADRSEVFAEGLLIPTGIAPGDGGVYVAQSTDLLFLKDVDGDGRADIQERILSGFGTEDTHHNLHTLRWGLDGCLYMNQSVYTRSDIETPHGVIRLKGGGGFRFDPRSLRMEVFFQGLWNSWGHQLDRFGQSFLTDGAGFDGVAYAFPGAMFRPTPHARRELDLISPGKWPKFASLEIIQGNSFPQEWQGNLITCDFRANRIVRMRLSEQGAGFVTEQLADLLRTNEPTFRPIDVKQGPDGALYIADWSNPIINHGEVDFRDPRRDRWHGRIWRVAWKGNPHATAAATRLVDHPTDQLLDKLISDDRFAREQTRRILTERGTAVLPLLDAWVQQHAQNSEALLAALWLKQSLLVADVDLLDMVFQASDGRIRAAAVRVLSDWIDAPDDGASIEPSAALTRLRRLVADPHPRVRLEAVRALGKLPQWDAVRVALQALDSPVDRFIDYALWLTLNELSDVLMEELRDHPQRVEELAPKHVEVIFTSLPPERSRDYVATRLARGQLDFEGSGPWIELLGKVGGKDELEVLFRHAVDGELSPAATLRVLTALQMASRMRRLHPQDRSRLLSLLRHPEVDVRLAAVDLAGQWKLAAAIPALRDRVHRDAVEQSGAASRAISALRQIGQPAAQTLRALGQDDNLPWRTRGEAAAALASIDATAGVTQLLELMTTPPTRDEATRIWRAALANRGVGRVVAENLPHVQLPPDAQVALWDVLRETNREEPELLAAAESLMQDDLHVAWTPDRIKQLVAQAEHADPHRGEFIYRREDLACTKCHAIGGIGGEVGPDLSSIGASAPIDYIAESLVLPNEKIKEGFHALTIVTEDDQILNGILVTQDNEKLVLRDAENRLLTVPTQDIVATKMGGSLMPQGVMDRLSDQQRADLLRFLSELGRPGPFDASRRDVAREVEILAGTHRLEQQGIQRIVQGEQQQGWQRYPTLVDGSIPRHDVEKMTEQPVNIALVTVYLRARIQWAQMAEVTLDIEGPRNAQLWVDGQAVKAAADDGKPGRVRFQIPATAGRHSLVVRVDARELPEAIRLRTSAGSFLGIEN